MKIDLKHYKKNRVEKLEAVTTGINIERRHKVFVESNGVNLSALVRDVLDELMRGEESVNATIRKVNES